MNVPINTFPKDHASAADFASKYSTLLYIPSPQLRTLNHLQLSARQMSRRTRSQMVVIVGNLKVVVRVEILEIAVVVVVIKLSLMVRRGLKETR